MLNRMGLRGFVAVVALVIVGCGGGGGGGSSNGETVFEVTVENVSTANQLLTSGGISVTVAFSPAVFVVHDQPSVAFVAGSAATAALESLAEDSNPGELAEAVQQMPGVSLVGIAQTPVGEASASVLLPGASYRLAVRGKPGDRLTLLSSFIQANDVFLSSPEAGIELFDGNGAAISGDITSSFQLFDAGTEVNERPGEGANQSPRQSDANTGTTEGGVVGVLNDGFSYPAVAQMIRVRIAVASVS